MEKGISMKFIVKNINIILMILALAVGFSAVYGAEKWADYQNSFNV